MNSSNNTYGLSGSTLKLIACVCMAIDHIGHHLLPEYDFLRVIGRIAFPIFAFLIAEGCRYTRNRLRYFLTIFLSGLLFFGATYAFSGMVFYNVFLNFSLAIPCIYLLQYFKRLVFSGKLNAASIVGLSFAYALVLCAAYVTLKRFPAEYGFFGMLIPILVSFTHLREYTDSAAARYFDNHFIRVIITAILLLPLHLSGRFSLQIFAVLSLPFLLFYNGKVGTRRLKYFFYAFYPAHIAVIYAVKELFFNK